MSNLCSLQLSEVIILILTYDLEINQIMKPWHTLDEV
jgi:hypothetical protein